MKARNIIIGIWLCTAMQVAAQSLSREEYRLRVADYSQVLKQAQQKTVAGRASLSLAKKGFLPKLDLNAQGSINLNKWGDWSGTGPGIVNVGQNGASDLSYFPGTYRCYTYQGVLTAAQPIYVGGGLSAQKKIAEADNQLNLLTEELTMDQVHYQADAIYWNASSALAVMEVMTQYRDIVEKQYKVIEDRFNDGAISRTDLLMIQTRRKEAELQYINARKSYTIAIQNLHILMGVAPNAPAETLCQIGVACEPIKELSFDEVLTRRADYQSTEVNLEKMRYARKAALSKFMPQLSGFVTGGWSTPTPYMSTSVKFNVITGINFSAPIFHWNERGQTNRQQKAYVAIQELQRSYQADAILKELSNALTSVNESLKQVSTAEENMEVAQQSLDLNTFSYNEGRSSIVEVLSAQLSWIQAQTNLISAYVANKMAVAEYRRVISE